MVLVPPGIDSAFLQRVSNLPPPPLDLFYLSFYLNPPNFEPPFFSEKPSFTPRVVTNHLSVAPANID